MGGGGVMIRAACKAHLHWGSQTRSSQRCVLTTQNSPGHHLRPGCGPVNTALPSPKEEREGVLLMGSAVRAPLVITLLFAFPD